MSNNASLTPVKDLKPFKTKWRSQVKVLHSWLQNTGFGGETLQMVLTDEQVRVKMQSDIFLVFLNMLNLHDVVFLLLRAKGITF